MTDLGPVKLEGRTVRLEPLRPRHREGLLAAAQSPEIWPWMFSNLSEASMLDRFIAEAMELEEYGTEYAFAVVKRESGGVLGSTRYMDVQPMHRGVEIGWTWYTPRVWGTVVNPECKLLLLRHAFEDWGAVRVCLKTDGLNARSQAAIRKLGAVYEGTLRKHRVRPDGTYRDTVYFSVLDSEWPQVREGLERRVGGGGEKEARG